MQKLPFGDCETRTRGLTSLTNACIFMKKRTCKENSRAQAEVYYIERILGHFYSTCIYIDLTNLEKVIKMFLI